MKKFIGLSLVVMTTLTMAQAQKSSNSMDSTFTMTLSRTFSAPPEMLWKAWSDPALVKQWWGPNGFTAPVTAMNFKEGGVSIVCMRSPDGFEIYNTWTYSKIQPMHRIEYVLRFSDKDGNTLDPAAIGLPPGIPEAVPHVILFEDLGNGATKLTVTESGYAAQQTADISKMGMQQCLDKMEKLLAGIKSNQPEKQ